MNKFGMRSDVISYSLGGMGCSSGVLGLQLVADLLQVRLCCATETPPLLSKARTCVIDGPRLVHQEAAGIRCCSVRVCFGLKSQLDCGTTSV